MRNRRTSSEHQAAVSRRLAELSDQLAAAPRAAYRPVEAVDEEMVPAAGEEWWSGYTHVTPPPPSPTEVREPPLLAAEPAPVPVPGRHAARRAGALGDLLPETLRGPVRLGAAQVAVVAVLVACGLAVTCWWVVRGDPDPPVPVAPGAPGPQGDLVALPSGAPAGAPPAAATSPPGAADDGQVTVDVAGKVRRPGIVVLDAGARVVDALKRAGGARPGVDLTSLNLARTLVDGEQIVVGMPGAAVTLPGASPPPPVPGGAPAALVDLNLATQAELETLPEVGPVTATAIIAWRDEHGGFSAVTELLEVDGIGDVTLARLTPLVTV